MTGNRLTWVLFVLLGTTLLTLTGCGANRTPLATVSGLPWPPPPGVTHQTSNDVVVEFGNEAIALGVGAKISGTAVKLQYTPGQVTYGIWSLGGFSSILKLRQVNLHFRWLPDPPNALTKLFIGLANCDKGCWEWYEVSTAEAAAGEWRHFFDSDSAYIHDGSISVTAVITGMAGSLIEDVEFSRKYSNYVPNPQNLHVTGTNIGSISLDWDDIPDVTGYNLYSAKYPDFRDKQLVEGSPITLSEFTDLTGTKGAIMYYRVAAVRGTVVSALSNMVDVFDPQADLIPPENIQFGEITETSIEITWEWQGGPSPESWVVYWKTYPDFNLINEGVVFDDWTMGYSRHYTFEGLAPGSVTFFRIAARNAGQEIGRMTDDAPLTTEALWRWEPMERTEIPAQEPMRAVVADGDITAAYFMVRSIMIARRDQGNWTEYSTPLTYDTTSLALGYAGGEYAIAARTMMSDDVAATVGTPGGSWSTPVRIHGDGNSGIGHPWSGVNMRMATNGSEFALIHWASDSHEVFLHTRPVGGDAWTKQALRSVTDSEPTISLCYAGNNLGVLIKNNLENPVYFGDRDSAFTFTQISPDDGTSWGMANTLGYMLDHWIAFVESFSERDPYFYVQVGPSWDYTPMDVSPTKYDGHFELEVDGQSAYLLLWSSPRAWHFFVLEDGVWVDKLFYYYAFIGSDPQLVVLNHEVYIVYVDQFTDTLTCVKGTPPA